MVTRFACTGFVGAWEQSSVDEQVSPGDSPSGRSPLNKLALDLCL
jgi:hypothetical protein